MRQGQYTDSGINPMMAAQMQHVSTQRFNNSGMGQFSGGTDSFHAGEEHQYMSSKAEAQWQRDKEGLKGANQLPSHMYKEGQGHDASRSLYDCQRSDSKYSVEKQASNKDPRVQAHQNELEVVFEDNVVPQTFENLEEKFLQDILNLTKEQQDAEDRENVRHREKLSEINAQYQEKLQVIRARQATQREEFLHKESQARHQQYQQINMNSYQNTVGPSEAHGFGPVATSANAFGDPHRAYAAGHYDQYVERSDFGGSVRGHGLEHRGQYPHGRGQGRAYNSGGGRRY